MRGRYTDSLPLGTKRERIYTYIKNHPGFYNSQICRNLNIKGPVFNNEVHALKRVGLVKSKKIGKKVKYYPTGYKIKEKSLEEQLISILLSNNKDISEESLVKELVKLTGIKRGRLDYNLGVMNKQEIITIYVAKDGKEHVCIHPKYYNNM